MTKDELKEAAASLPLEPGVYLMKDKTNTVIYVGKAKKLKNRVSQYFQENASHTPKTRRMVSLVDHFETIRAASEFEALVLECSLIKHYMPKYNILLKDDKGYPYLRLDMKEPYPKLTLASRVCEDGARYFGPYGSRGRSNQVIRILQETFRLPDCGKKFPRDVGKERPCLNYHMGKCDGWCREEMSQTDYRGRMEQIQLLLTGRHKPLCQSLRQEMEAAAEALRFEQAAQLRDRLRAIEALSERQLVTAGTLADTDVIGWYETEARACFAVLHFVGGNLMDKDYELLSLPDDRTEALSSLVKQYYISRQAAPRRVLLPFSMEDAEPFSQLLLEQLGKKTRFLVPARGDNLRLQELARQNAREEAERATSAAERHSATMSLLQTMLGLRDYPARLEAYDISNIAGTDIVASMTVFVDGKPKKSDYKRFKLENMEDQDDYASMRQVLCRRFCHYLDGDRGFDELPSALLIDGGAVHAKTVEDALTAMGVHVPIYGMVKDNRHRTRALVTPDGAEIGIQATPAVFALIGRIQEETHRFAITYHHTLRSRRVRGSSLDAIPGIGEKRRLALLRHFQSISAIREASMEALRTVLPEPAARAVYQYYHSQE